MLHIESFGRGADLVMLHGWAMHSGIWADWALPLGRHFRVHLLDLPGHGHSGHEDDQTLDQWADAALAAAPSGAWWLGWSLGGLVAMHAARRVPERVRGLVLLSSTPRFVSADDWACAVDAAVFGQFGEQLAADIERTLTRFIALQVRGADNSGASLRQLRTRLQTRPQARAPALRNGLALLAQSDLRAALARLDVPLYWLLGERDTLVPATLAARVPGSCSIVPGAGHAPFLSHPQASLQQIEAWLVAGREYSAYAGR